MEAQQMSLDQLYRKFLEGCAFRWEKFIKLSAEQKQKNLAITIEVATKLLKLCGGQPSATNIGLAKDIKDSMDLDKKQRQKYQEKCLQLENDGFYIDQNKIAKKSKQQCIQTFLKMGSDMLKISQIFSGEEASKNVFSQFSEVTDLGIYRPRSQPYQFEDLLSDRKHSNEHVHLSFLFASPLILKVFDGKSTKFYENQVVSDQPISFEQEFSQIKQSIEDQKNVEFNYLYQLATKHNLKKALRRNPIGIHFSGHGFRNKKSLYGEEQNRAYNLYKDNGDVLLFESDDPYGASEFMFESEIKNILEESSLRAASQYSKTNSTMTLDDDKESLKPQFVILTACNSENVGKIFLNAGIKHVICVDKQSRLLDKAAIEFSEMFYDIVFDDCRPICEAFNKAQKEVKRKFGKSEANKLILLNDGHKEEDCKPTDDRLLKEQSSLVRRDDAVKIRQLEVFNAPLILPNKVNTFVFRNKDIFDPLVLLQKNETVQIFGFPGLGKTSLLKKICHYTSERQMMKDGMIYIDFAQLETFEKAKDMLVEKCNILKEYIWTKAEQVEVNIIIDDIWRIYDKDNSGVLEIEEAVKFFKAFMKNKQVTPGTQRLTSQDMQEEFKKLDVDNSKDLSKEEMKSFVRKHLPQPQQVYEGEEGFKLLIDSIPNSFLLALDNIDSLWNNEDDSHYTKFLEYLYSLQKPQQGRKKKKNCLKILFCSSNFKNIFNPDTFAVKNLKRLNDTESIKLFMNRVPLSEEDKNEFFSFDKIKELHDITLKIGGDKYANVKAPNERSGKNGIEDYLKSHPFIKMTAGIPFVIASLASLTVTRSLADIFIYLNNSSRIDVGYELTDSKKAEAELKTNALITSVECCLEHLEDMSQNDPEFERIIELWFLIGSQGSGIFKRFLSNLFVDEESDKILLQKDSDAVTSEMKYHKCLSELIDMSLVEKEIVDKQGRFIRYRVSPFIYNYINQKMTRNERKGHLENVAQCISAHMLKLKIEYAKVFENINPTPYLYDKAVKVLEEEMGFLETQILYVISELNLMDQMSDEEEKVSESSSVKSDKSETAFGDEGRATLEDLTELLKMSSPEQSQKVKRKSKWNVMMSNVYKNINMPYDEMNLVAPEAMPMQKAQSHGVPMKQKNISSVVKGEKKKSVIFEVPIEEDANTELDLESQISTVKKTLSMDNQEEFKNVEYIAEKENIIETEQIQCSQQLFKSTIKKRKAVNPWNNVLKCNDLAQTSKTCGGTNMFAKLIGAPGDLDVSRMTKKKSKIYGTVTPRGNSFGSARTSTRKASIKLVGQMMNRDSVKSKTSTDSFLDNMEIKDEPESPDQIQSVIQEEDEEKPQQIQTLKILETMTFHFLSVLALIPNKREDLNSYIQKLSSYKELRKQKTLKVSEETYKILLPLFAQFKKHDEKTFNKQEIERRYLKDAKFGEKALMEEFNDTFRWADSNKDGILWKDEFYQYQIRDFENRLRRHGAVDEKDSAATREESDKMYDDYYNKISPATDGVSQADFELFNQALIKHFLPSKEEEWLMQQAQGWQEKKAGIIDLTADDTSDLFKANILLLELLLKIEDNRQDNSHIKLSYDTIYEYCREIIQYSEKIQFKRGLAIAYYVKGKRALKKLHKVNEFINYMTKAAEVFTSIDCNDGILQCIVETKEKMEESAEKHILLKDLEKMQEQLCDDEEVEIQFHNFATKIIVKPNKETEISRDHIFDMLFNPETQLEQF